MKNIKYIVLTCLITILSASCEDTVLNLDDPGSPTEATFFKTSTQLEVALAGVYHSLSFVRQAPFPQVLDHATDYAYNRGNVAGTGTATQGGLTSTDGLINDFWSNYYTGIQRANNVLGNMHKAKDVTNPTRYEEIRAEALFLRALFYSYLIELYGDVPFRTEVVTSLDDVAMARTPKEQIVKSIIADLETAAGILPLSQPSSGRGRASKNAANALIARIALYNANYTLAASKANEVITNGGLSLYPNYENLFAAEGVGSSEVILDISFTDGIKTHMLSRVQGTRVGGWCQLVPLQQLVDSYETINGLPIDEDPAYNPAKPFENRDPRLAASIVLPGAEWCDHIIYQHSDSIATWKVSNGQKTERVFNLNSANPGGRKIKDPLTGIEYTTGGSNRFTSFTGYFWKKFSDEPLLIGPGNPSESVQPIILMRYAEVLLTYAEAKIEGGTIDGSVLNAINQVKQRAYNGSGVSYPEVKTTNKIELRKIIRRERKIELADEGFRLFDIRRWKIAEKIMNTNALGGPANGFSKIGGQLKFIPTIDDDGFVTYPNAPIQPRVELGNFDFRDLEVRVFDKNKDYLWPIPQAEIDATKGLVTQNTGY